ncbi:MAG: S8 family serine peptidase [Planctomycetota bacterium]|nr:S8 family serine peptidase [Planctomycetota bacterium]
MFTVPGLLAATLVGAALATTAAPPVSTGEAALRPELARVVRTAAADQLIPISIVMKAQATRGELNQLGRMSDKPQRRAAVIARLKEVAQASNRDLLAALEEAQARGTVGPRIRPLWLRNVVATQATGEVILRLTQRDDIAYINYDRPVGEEILARGPVNPAGGRSIEYGVELMRAPEVWDMGITGEGVVVGIIDTGCCITHPDIENQLWNNEDEVPGNGVDDDGNGYVDDIVGYNFWEGTNDVYDSGGHGTHTAGTVCGDGTDGTQTGMAPDCQMMILKFWNNFSGESVVWEAMQYAADNDADVVTASIGWPHYIGPDRATWRAVCENTIAAGVAVFYAAGNEGNYDPPVDNIRTPGDVPDVITVGATDEYDNAASFTSIGPVTWENVPPYNDWPYPPGKIKPSIAAPGVDTISCRHSPCNSYTSMSGTSMATPHAAGAAALLLQANPNLDHFGVKEALMETAVDLGEQGMDNTFGAGRIDAYEAVMAVMEDCPADFDGDGDVDTADLLFLLQNWGTSGGDTDGDGDTDTADLLYLLSAWGDCP